MRVFADTSGLFALLVRNDLMHVRAKLNFQYFAEHDAHLLTSSFVVVETLALLQRRVGLEAVYDFQLKITPLLEVLWIDKDWYTRGIQRLFALNNSNISLVDCLSFEIMESRAITCAFSFDEHFEEYGFSLAAFHNLDR
ncbi:MAG: PIN domain-containing protein [Deltaproteobacteria bacterium]|nr:PIN domain-containing protein [Deltaproteobacteria bacterium]